MSRRVPDFVNPFRAAEGGHVIAGRIEFTRMKRLMEAVDNHDGAAELSLNFAVDEQGIPHVKGRVNSEVALVCQRCLEPMTLPISIEMDLGIVASDEAVKRLPEYYEPLIVGDKPLSVAEMVEEEIMLALPAVPRHEPGVCVAANTASGERPEDGNDKESSSNNPFAVLARLKSKH